MKLILTLVALLSASHLIAEEVPQRVKDMADTLSAWGSDSKLISAVKAQNAKGASLDSIKARDAEWRKVEGLDTDMKNMMSSDAAKRLSELEQSAPYFFELFLMDNQGANIAMTNKTSDYWQGDEAKWQQSFAEGKGAVHFGEVEFDSSAQAYLVQVSVPVMENTQAIGAITIGINLDDLDAN